VVDDGGFVVVEELLSKVISYQADKRIIATFVWTSPAPEPFLGMHRGEGGRRRVSGLCRVKNRLAQELQKSSIIPIDPPSSLSLLLLSTYRTERAQQ
jgi:hypothetical protein